MSIQRSINQLIGATTAAAYAGSNIARQKEANLRRQRKITQEQALMELEWKINDEVAQKLKNMKNLTMARQQGKTVNIAGQNVLMSSLNKNIQKQVKFTPEERKMMQKKSEPVVRKQIESKYEHQRRDIHRQGWEEEKK